jgi:hypothetical protein
MVVGGASGAIFGGGFVAGDVDGQASSIVREESA